MPPTRVLCLHGYRSCGAKFRSRLGEFRRKTKKVAELIFTDAPHSVAAADEEGDFLGWWVVDAASSGHKRGLSESLDHVEALIEHLEIASLLGFSQGGTIALLVALRGRCPSVQSYVVAAGFFPDLEQFINPPLGLDRYVSGAAVEFLVTGGTPATNTPSPHSTYTHILTADHLIRNSAFHISAKILIVAGEKDRQVPVEGAIAPLYLFPSTTAGLVVHPRGHYLPCVSPILQTCRKMWGETKTHS